MFQGLITEIERLSLEFSLIAWHTVGSVKERSHCRVGSVDAFVAALRTPQGDLVVTILPRGDRWCVYQMPNLVLLEDRFPRMVDGLRLLLDRGERSEEHTSELQS